MTLLNFNEYLLAFVNMGMQKLYQDNVLSDALTMLCYDLVLTVFRRKT